MSIQSHDSIAWIRIISFRGILYCLLLIPRFWDLISICWNFSQRMWRSSNCKYQNQSAVNGINGNFSGLSRDYSLHNGESVPDGTTTQPLYLDKTPDQIRRGRSQSKFCLQLVCLLLYDELHFVFFVILIFCKASKIWFFLVSYQMGLEMFFDSWVSIRNWDGMFCMILRMYNSYHKGWNFSFE